MRFIRNKIKTKRKWILFQYKLRRGKPVKSGDTRLVDSSNPYRDISVDEKFGWETILALCSKKKMLKFIKHEFDSSENRGLLSKTALLDSLSDPTSSACYINFNRVLCCGYAEPMLLRLKFKNAAKRR
jgi:hypothetical protein